MRQQGAVVRSRLSIHKFKIMNESSKAAAGSKFDLGQVYMTPGASKALAESGEHPFSLLRRHQSGDWGDLCQEDKDANDEAVTKGGRILSAYHTKARVKIWAITEWDRSATTLLLPDEY